MGNEANFQLQEEYTRWEAVSPGNFVRVLILEGKCLHWRARPAHLGGHLPLESPLVKQMEGEKTWSCMFSNRHPKEIAQQDKEE